MRDVDDTPQPPRPGHGRASADAITSLRNPLVVDVVALHRPRERRRRAQTLLEGPQLVGEALASGVRPTLLLTLERTRWLDAADRVLEVDQAVLTKVATTRTAQDPVAVVAIPDPVPPVGDLRLLMWGVSDPGNAGTLIRSAAAFGAGVVIGGRGSVDPWAPKVLRAAAGAHFRVPIAVVDEPAAAWEGTTSVALVVAGGVAPSEVPPGPVTVVVGAEAAGLPEELVAACALRCTIPMPGGTDSLNVAVAGSIALHALATRGG
jgi:RNA methyltransferase, TrmH family